MKFADHLSREQIQQFNKMRHAAKNQKENPKPKKEEKLSRRDIEELMGANRDTYTRRNGAVRRR